VILCSSWFFFEVRVFQGLSFTFFCLPWPYCLWFWVWPRIRSLLRLQFRLWLLWAFFKDEYYSWILIFLLFLQLLDYQYQSIIINTIVTSYSKTTSVTSSSKFLKHSKLWNENGGILLRILIDNLDNSELNLLRSQSQKVRRKSYPYKSLYIDKNLYKKWFLKPQRIKIIFIFPYLNLQDSLLLFLFQCNWV